MDKKRKTFVIVSVLCFLVALIFAARGTVILSLAFFTISSLLPILALADSERDLSGKKEDNEAKRMFTALQERHDALRSENLTLKERVDELNRKLDVKEMTTDSESAQADMAFSSILPGGEGEAAKKQTLDITKIIKEAAADFSKVASAAGVDIRVMEPEAPMYVSASPVMLKTMFRDIIDNAVKYMRREGALQITIANLDDDIFIAMKDNGEGLSEDETPHIFELNFQGSNRISGNGLGLAQVKAIVDYYGGMIYAKSALGRGMGIYLHLPAERR